MATTGSQSEYAMHAGVSAAYVTKLKKEGRLVFADAERKIVDFALTDRMVRNTADMGRSTNGRNSRPDGSSSNVAAPIADGKSVDVVFRKAQAQERVFDAKMAELNYQERVGTLIRVDAVEKVWSIALASAREHLMQMRARLASQLAAESDPFKVDQMLDEEISAALAHLSGVSLQPKVTR